MAELPLTHSGPQLEPRPRMVMVPTIQADSLEEALTEVLSTFWGTPSGTAVGRVVVESLLGRLFDNPGVELELRFIQQKTAWRLVEPAPLAALLAWMRDEVSLELKDKWVSMLRRTEDSAGQQTIVLRVMDNLILLGGCIVWQLQPTQPS